MLTKTEIILK